MCWKLEAGRANTEGDKVSWGGGGFLAALPDQTALREGKHKDANEGLLGIPVTSQVKGFK